MIQSRRLEFNIQLGVFIVGILIVIGSCMTYDIGVGFVGFYFGVGISQLISLVRSALSQEKWSRFTNIYAWMLIPVWIILTIFVLLAALQIEVSLLPDVVNNVLGTIIGAYLGLALFFSPVLAIGFLVHLHDAMWRNERRL